MIVIFLGTTAVHTALAAAHLFLGKSDLSGISTLGDASLESQNRLLFIGTDEAGNDVFTIGAGKELLMVKKSIEDLRDLLGYKEDDLTVVATSAPGDGLLALLLKIPDALGGRAINRKLSQIILAKHYG